VLSLLYGDFALQWQPVPLWVPGRTLLAFASGTLLVLASAGILSRLTTRLSTGALLIYSLLWLLLLKLPHVVIAPSIEVNWLGFGEIAVIVAACWTLFANDRSIKESSLLNFAIGERGLGGAQLLFALALIPVGLSHFVYARQTLALVPAWIPFPKAWVYLTGAAHLAAALGVLFGVLPRLAALMEAAMIGVFTLLVWVPLVAKLPTNRLQWTGFLVSWTIAAAAWVVADGIARRKPTEVVWRS
jgi:uncharacterized membrane protein